MSPLASRYRAICEIAEHCSASGDLDSTLRRILSAGESALPETPLELLLADGDGHRSISSEFPRGRRMGGRAASDRVTPHALARRILACTQPSSVVITGRRSPARAWVVPLNKSLVPSGAVICREEGLCDADKEFLETIARYLSVCISSKQPQRGEEAGSSPVEKRIDLVSAIYEISQAFDNTPISDLLKQITKRAAQVMDAQACSLMLKDPNKDELVIKASYGLSEKIVEETRAVYGKGVAGRVAQTGAPMLLNDLRGDPRFVDADVTPRHDIVSSICVPLRDEEALVQGVLSIRRTAPAAPFTENDVKLFSVFASQAALAISNAHLYSSLKERVQELSTLYEASRRLSGAYSLRDAARALVRLAVDMVGDVSAILVLLDGHRKASVLSASGVSAKLRRTVGSSMDDGTGAWMRGLREPRSFSLESPTRWPSAMKPLASALEGDFVRVSLVPLVAEDTVIGMLILGGREKRSPEHRRIRLLSIAASQAATVIKNASRHEEQIEQKALELTALYELSERISTAGNLKQALDSILDIVRDIVRYDESFISTVDYERNVMTVQACRGISDGRLREGEFAFSEDSLISWAIRERKALVSPDISKDPRFRQPSVRNGAVRSLMAIPLIVHDEVVGVLNVHAYDPNLYTEENVRILSVIASQAAALYKELEALSALANYTDNILTSIAAGVLTLDRDGRVLTWNKAAEDIIGIPADEAVGGHFLEVVGRIGISSADKQRVLGAINRVLETGQTYVGYKQEYRTVEKETLYMNMNVSQLRDHVGEMLGLVIIVEDVTKEVRMENEMRRISELAAIGQLAASVAHELRNPLSSIKGAAQYLRKEYDDHGSVREFLDIIIDEVNVLNKVTTEFLDFARPIKLNLRETDINDVIFRTLQFMQLDITKQNVVVEQSLAYDIPRTMADDKQLEQVFRNMILNSLQAMPDGGKLAVSTRAFRDGVRVVIADSGVGIPEDALDQVFVPFFTTRTKGTGLGLSVVQKIIDNHGGKVSVRSAVGEGTTFEIFLPVCSDKARAAMIRAEGAAEIGGSDIIRRGQAGLQC